jgi:hypothetical protein
MTRRHRGDRNIVLPIYNFGGRRWWVLNATPCPLYTGKNSWVLLGGYGKSLFVCKDICTLDNVVVVVPLPYKAWSLVSM